MRRTRWVSLYQGLPSLYTTPFLPSATLESRLTSKDKERGTCVGVVWIPASGKGMEEVRDEEDGGG